jgi:hypothetical protein
MPAPTALRAPEDVPLPEDEVEMLDQGTTSQDKEFLLAILTLKIDTETLDPTISAPVILEPSSKDKLPSDYSMPPSQSAEGQPLFAPSTDTPTALRVETRKVLVPPHRFAS